MQLTFENFSPARFKDTMDELQEFMHARDLPMELRTKLKSFYMLKFPTMKICEQTHMSPIPEDHL